MEDKIIFVLGSGKCGTTSLTHLLNCSSEIDARHEEPPKLWEYNRVVYDGNGIFGYERLYWNSRESLINGIRKKGKVFAEVNHRSSVFLPYWKEMFPKAKYVVLWRDFDETVVSMARWGCYSNKDAGKRYRLQPNKELEYRQACAWYWVTIYDYILNHLPEGAIVLPLQWMENREVKKIQNIFDKLDVELPDVSAIEDSLSIKKNIKKTDRKIEKNWGIFDKKAEEITGELRRLSV